ncbi:hypothetical protein [Halogranum rubrum]|uniref:Uncharacterized protein n=1 Tax=Halogranum salarium B-1 TaxID=1210908 RepID=J3EUA1_9EURY|nr:hypothetical protein [Halogranum salarium]EJN57922.1 hypothetical protein HSB1_33390 [Halogranum salarium B-1]
MKIITATCPECGTITAGNVLEQHRVCKCPKIDCERVLRFEDLSESDRQHLSENKTQYQL